MEKGFYLVTFLNEDEEVMSITDLTQPDEKVLLLGDYWPASQLTKTLILLSRSLGSFSILALYQWIFLIDIKIPSLPDGIFFINRQGYPQYGASLP
uniref:DUF6911 family protein n=1 Tax=Pantoea sp. Nvir TaxID=2576760 RepID=UPI0030D46C28